MFDDLFEDNPFDGNESSEVLDEPIELDLDGDGYNETLSYDYDTDGDGITDGAQVFTDTDFDGYVDVYSEQAMLDTTGDGFFDTMVNHYDTTGDGFMDVREAMIDMDGDGYFDSQSILVDTDNDGVLDSYEEVSNIDVDGDGIIDTVLYQNDVDNDGYIDFTSADIDFNHDGIVDDTVNYDTYANVGTGITYSQNFDPDHQELFEDSIIGDPAGDMENWHMQTHGDTCAVVSQEFVLEEILGEDFDENELRDMALENGWYSDGGGTPAEHIGDLLEMHGLDVERSYDGTIDDIANCLENGGSVIVGLDADEIWTQGEDYVRDELLEDSPFAPGAHPNHAVEVIGIDSSDPDNVMVILNDPGSPDGCGSMIPIDEFMGAWEDSDNLLVTAYK